MPIEAHEKATYKFYIEIVRTMHIIFCRKVFLGPALTLSKAFETGVAPGIFRQGDDSSDEGARIRLSGYCKCQKSPTN